MLRRLIRQLFGRHCLACGQRVFFRHQRTDWRALTEQWELDRRWARWFRLREGTQCGWCGTNLRSQQLAGEILAYLNPRLGTRHNSVKSLFADPASHALRIAEINACRGLHRLWRHHPHLAYSEYAPETPGVRHEDLLALSYPDESFDLVLTSETLEHVPDAGAACREIGRVLRPGGAHLFTVPVVWGRKTRKRAEIRDGRLIHLLPPSHHGAPGADADDYLVFYEFGDDVLEFLGNGFFVHRRTDPHNRSLNTFIAIKA